MTFVVSSPGGQNDAEAASSSQEGLSAFVARVLDQLSLTAWLPAALGVASLTVLVQFHRQKSVDPLVAANALTLHPLRLLVIMLPVLITATMVTQAFSFGAIRTLEGYWHRRGVAASARTAMIKRHVKRQRAIEQRLGRAYQRAFATARLRMLRSGVPHSVVNALEAQVLLLPPPPITPAEQAEVDGKNWRLYCDAWQLAHIDHLIKEGDRYPKPSRILPTKLGNVLRATEDLLTHADGDVEGFALRRRNLVPARIQLHHDQFRNRLDMYCTLVFVSGFVAIAVPIILTERNISTLWIMAISMAYTVLSVTSYLAAIASASGYCAVLVQMDKAMNS